MIFLICWIRMIINYIILPVFWGPNSVYQTPTGSQSLQRWGSPSIIFCSHSSFLPSTNSYMRSSYTPQQRNRKIHPVVVVFAFFTINNFIDKNANDPLKRTCESIHHFHNCPQPTLFTLRSISATLLLREERGLILPNSEKNSSKKSFL